jgi:hypothetical protein
VSRAFRLGRSLRGIVASVVAAPLAGAAACSSQGAKDSAADAMVPVEHDAGGIADATLSSKWASDACAAAPFDDVSAADTLDGCVSFGRLPCGLIPTAEVSGCVIDGVSCVSMCRAIGQPLTITCELAPASCDPTGDPTDGANLIECFGACVLSGRRPLGLRAARTSRRTSLGDYFASRRLSLLSRRFADDERRHARAVARLARRFGGVIPPVRIRQVERPTLAQLVEDDAVEGCVKETFGALLAIWQAERAEDGRVRRMMRRIAADETRHAALAWEILDWGVERLSPRDRQRVEERLDRAVVALASARVPVSPAVRQIAGYPDREQERRLTQKVARLIRRRASALHCDGHR